MPPFFGLFSLGGKTERTQFFFFFTVPPAERQHLEHVGAKHEAPVVVGDDGRERSGTDAVANQVDLLDEEEPQPEGREQRQEVVLMWILQDENH